MSRTNMGMSSLCAFALALTAASRAVAQPACDPSTMCCVAFDSGSTCGGAGVATLGNTSGLDLGVGNPINVLNGNKFQREVDMPALPGVLGLELVRYYNSADTRNGPLGRGWRLSYETELRVRPRGLELLQADGTRLFFGPDEAGDGVYRTRDPLQGLVRALPGAGGTEHLWLWADGRELRFNVGGQLEQIRVPSGEFVSLRYSERGWLTSVIDPAGRRLDLQYLDKAGARSGERYRGVQSILTPVGRYRYEHGDALSAGSKSPRSETVANLVRVHYPAAEGRPSGEASGRQYHHEDARFPTLLTGISALAGEGAAGLRSERLSTWAYDAQRRAELSATDKGDAARRVSLEWRPGQNGWKGQGEALLSDGRGHDTVYTTALVAGERRLLRVRGPGCPDCAAGDRRYGYDALGRLVEETRLDPQGRPMLTRRTERDPQGRALRLVDISYRDGRAMPPQWRARYEYAAFDARDPLALPDPRPVLIATPSVLPGRERRIRLRYNAARQLVSITEEGFSPVNAQGRPAPAGAGLQRVTRYGYAQINGRSVRVSVDGPLPNGATDSPADSDVTLFEWDARGERVVRVTRPGALVRQFAHGPATGRLAGLTDPAGVATGLRGYPPAVRHDAWERPIAWPLPGRAEPVLKAHWGPMGSAAEHSVLRWEAGQAYAQREVDDFGRVVAIRQHGQGGWTAAHDAAGRPVLITDPRGASQRLSWDVAGRWRRIEYLAPGESWPQQTVQRRYEAERLVEESVSDADGVRRTRYIHDPHGTVLSETLEIRPAGELASVLAHPLSLTLAYRYAPGGELLAREITDATGRRLVMEQAFDAQGQVRRIGTRGVLPRWLGGGRDLLRAVEWQALGALRYATRIVHGDGSVDAFDPLPEAAADPLLHAAAPAGPGAMPLQPTARRAPPGLAHDAAGLPAWVQTAQGLQGLRWNAAGRLVQTQREHGHSRYVYDARGRRIATLVLRAQAAPSVRLAVYEDHRLLAEADAEGRLSHGYAHLGHRSVAQLVLPRGWGWAAFKAWLFGPAVRHLHTARAGRVLSASEDGATVWRDGEEPAKPELGTAPGAESSTVRVHQPLRYVGQYHDDESGLDYHGARFFEPGVGRFISPDPAGVADAIDGLAPSYLLDTYAYAGDQPEEYFDPDGAARIRYFAITTNAQGKSMGSTQGFVKARWAFIVDQVATGGDSSTVGQLRDRYASEGRSVLVDVEGSFLGKGNTSVVWGGPEATMAQDFLKHYGDKLISIPQFTIDDMSDDDATRLIASYIEADKQQLSGAGCPVRAALLPPIRFAPGEEVIHVDRQVEPPLDGSRANQANAQSILNCKRPTSMPIAYANDEERRRIAKYEAAAELQESPPTSAIYKDCSSNNGCRSGTAITVNGNRYYASYGRTQFVVETFLRTLESLAAGLSAAQKNQLRLDEVVTLPDGSAGTMMDMLRIARARSTAAAKAFDDLRDSRKGFGTGLTAEQSAAAWSSMPPAQREDFRRHTGLDGPEFVDMLTFVPDGRARTNAEAKNAFGSEAAMSLLDGKGTHSFRDWLLWLYSSQDEYNFVSRMFLKDNLSTTLRATPLSGRFDNVEASGTEGWLQRQRVIEDELAQRVAALHNWGNVGRVTASPMRLPVWVRAYVDEFMSVAGRGDFRSLRCSDELGAIPGLRTQTLSLK